MVSEPGLTKFGPERWPLSSNSAIARNANGKLEVFMMGSDRQLYHSWEYGQVVVVDGLGVGPR